MSKRPPRSRSFRSSAKTSASHHCARSGGQRRIEREVLAGERERLRRAVDRDDARRAAGERRQREAAGVAERIEHLASGGEAPHGGAIGALVEIEPGLLAAGDVDAVDEPVLDERHAIGKRAVHDAGTRRQAFERAHVDIGALVRRTRRRSPRRAPRRSRRASAPRRPKRAAARRCRA